MLAIASCVVETQKESSEKTFFLVWVFGFWFCFSFCFVLFFCRFALYPTVRIKVLIESAVEIDWCFRPSVTSGYFDFKD